MPKLQRDGKNHYYLSMPRMIRAVKGWEKGEELGWLVSPEGEVVVREVRSDRPR